MSRRPSLVGAGLVLLLALAAGAWWWLRARPAAPPPSPPASAVSVVQGLTVVTLSPAAQRASGLQEQAVGRAAAAGSGVIAYGVVMDLQPLVDWRGRAVKAQADAQAARTQWTVATAERERLATLHAEEQIASLKALQAAQAEEARARSAAEAATASLRVLQADVVQQFGAVLAGWAQGRPGPMQQLLAHRASLVAMALGDGTPPTKLAVSAGAGPRWTATWVGRSMQADPKLGSGSQIYLVPAGLPANASVVAWAAGGGEGVFVPLPAVVWYADQPWAYVRRDGSHFARVPLLDATETPEGYVARGGIAAGASVVTQGAGLLLSQEQTPPPGGSPCKDPECDD